MVIKNLILMPVLVIFLIGIVAAQTYHLDVCDASYLNFTYNFFGNNTGTTFDASSNITCDNSDFIESTSFNLSAVNSTYAQLYIYNNQIYLDNSTIPPAANEGWIHSMFNSWYSVGNNTYTKIDTDDKFVTKTDYDNFKAAVVSTTASLQTTVDTVNSRVSSLKLEELNKLVDEPQFSTPWKIIFIINLVITLSIAAFMVKNMMGGSE